MKRITNLAAMAALMFSLALLFTFTTDNAYAQQKGKADKGYVDENGDGVNDNAKDADGDGIPNGQDPDYQNQNPMKGKGQMGFADEDGDGINDNANDDDGDGIPNGKDSDYVPPKDGSGKQMGRGKQGSQGKGAGPLENKFQNKVQTQAGQQVERRGKGARGFADENGDGINDNSRDTDGDGIPNGQDPDYERQNPLKGHGHMGFIDEDGDGINDNALDDDGDGIPNGKDSDYQKPQDGTGRKLGNARRGGNTGTGVGTGDCDGTGPKGNTTKRGRRK